MMGGASETSNHWKLLGSERRAGVCTPLFSIYSKRSLGVGEIPDLKLIIDWCVKSGLSLLQLLPLLDTGSGFSPYDCRSSFAMDPMYLSLDELKGCARPFFFRDIESLREKFKQRSQFLDYRFKKDKLALLRKIYLHESTDKNHPEFLEYVRTQMHWLSDYARYKCFKDKYEDMPWDEWSKETVFSVEELTFYYWTQWQLFDQLIQVKQYADQFQVKLIGDMPFFVSKDSADVWSRPEFFVMDRVAGAPPDIYMTEGQRWGMPIYDWNRMEETNYLFLRERLQYMEHFFHIYRIDHFVGLCRTWSIAVEEPFENGGRFGCFDPEDRKLWKIRGSKIIGAMLSSTNMLPLAEDLGMVPGCAVELLEEFRIPGMDIQRWLLTSDSQDYLGIESYREMSVSAFATHDMSAQCVWWCHEADEFEEKSRFLKWIGAQPEEPISVLMERAIGKIFETKSIFSIQLLQDYLALEPDFQDLYQLEARINRPGTVDERNWSLRMPVSVEEILNNPISAQILKRVQESARGGFHS